MILIEPRLLLGLSFILMQVFVLIIINKTTRYGNGKENQSR